MAREGLEPEKLYPNTFFLPESGIQRGSVCEGDGDPLSPDWTSIKGKFAKVSHIATVGMAMFFFIFQYCRLKVQKKFGTKLADV